MEFIIPSLKIVTSNAEEVDKMRNSNPTLIVWYYDRVNKVHTLMETFDEFFNRIKTENNYGRY